MDIDHAAGCLAQLGHPIRLKTVRLLVQAGDQGLPVKDVQDHLGIPASTLSFHLNHLISAGLVRQVREGRRLWCRAEFQVIRAVADFLLADCCRGAPAPPMRP
jgi:DNA-binding transcriptional ArsR family regulator